MEYSQESVSDGTLVELALSIQYFSREEITVYFDDVEVPEADSRWNWLGASSTTIQFTPAVPNGTTVRVQRRTAIDAMRHDFSAGAQFKADVLDENFEQLRRGLRELADYILNPVLYFLRTAAGAVSRTLQSKLEDTLNAKDFGMVADYDPDLATGTSNVDMLNAAVAELKVRGGTLVIPPGDYYFGAYSSSVNVMTFTDLANVKISGYGARFILSSEVLCTPFMLYFVNPVNVVVEGLSFFDSGFNPTAWLDHSRWGMAAIRLSATTPSRGFKMRDCVCDSLTYMLVADCRDPSERRMLSHITVEDCAVSNAYYGVDLIYVGDWVMVRNLRCKDVRRGFISYGQRNADVELFLETTAGFNGSNAFVSIAMEGNRDGYLADNHVDNLRVKVNVKGVEAHSGYVHLYHQQDDSAGVISNVDIDVKADNLTTVGKNAGIGVTSLVVIDHELPSTAILSSTSRVCENIRIHGSVYGTLSGRALQISSFNTTTKHSIELTPTMRALVENSMGGGVTDYRDKITWRSPVTFPMPTIVPVGVSTPGVASGVTQGGTVELGGGWCTFNMSIAWTGHTGTGNLRLTGIPAAKITAVSTPVITCTSSGLARPAGSTVIAQVGGVGGAQIILTEDSAGATIAVDTACTLWFSGSYQLA